jgi:hypothetical protein
MYLSGRFVGELVRMTEEGAFTRLMMESDERASPAAAKLKQLVDRC